jgi:hypothetical protein
MSIGDSGVLGANTSLILSNAVTPAASDCVDLLSESLSGEYVFKDLEGLQSSRFAQSQYHVYSHINPNGSFSFSPRYSQLSEFLTLALGDGLVPGTTDLPAGSIQLKRSDSTGLTFTGVRINECTLSSAENDIVKADCTVLASSFTETASVTPSFTALAAVPMQHSHLVLGGDVGSGEYCYSAKFHWNHNIDVGFANSHAPVHFPLGVFSCDAEIEMARSATVAALWGTYYKPNLTTYQQPSMSITATYSNPVSGGGSVTITFVGKISSPLPNISGKEAQKVTLKLTGYAATSVDPIKAVVS